MAAITHTPHSLHKLWVGQLKNAPSLAPLRAMVEPGFDSPPANQAFDPSKVDQLVSDLFGKYT